MCGCEGCACNRPRRPRRPRHHQGCWWLRPVPGQLLAARVFVVSSACSSGHPCGHRAIRVVIVPFACLSGHPCGRRAIRVVIVPSMSSVWLSCHPCGCRAIRVIRVVVVPSACPPCHHCLRCAVQKGWWDASVFWEDAMEGGRRGVGTDNWRAGGRAWMYRVGVDVPCGCGCTVWAWTCMSGQRKEIR